MSNKPDRTEAIQCFTCARVLSGKKAIECNDCSEYFCKEHIKVDEVNHTSICSDCFKKKIHLQVSLEMENQVLEAKAQLNTLKEKLKNSKKDLTNKKSTVERFDGQVKINEKTYLRKFENIEKRIEEEAKRSENILNTAESLRVALKDCTLNEKATEEKLIKARNERDQIQTELDTLKQENLRIKSDIQYSSDKLKVMVQYSMLRNTLCNSCKNKIKSAFKEEILKGNIGKESLIASVLAHREKNSIVNSMNTQFVGNEGNSISSAPANRERISVRNSMNTQIVGKEETPNEACAKCTIT